MTTSIIARSAGRFLIPLIFIFGFYVVVHGHLTPGGGFQGGAVIATGVGLLLVCYYYRDCMNRFIPVENFKLIEAAGLILFICTALSGLVIASSFIMNWAAAPVAFGPNAGSLLSAGIIPVLNFAVGIEVFGALSVVLLYMFSGLRETTQAEDDAKEAKEVRK